MSGGKLVRVTRAQVEPQPVAARWHRLDLELAMSEPPPPVVPIFGDCVLEAGEYGLVIGADGARKSWLGLHIAFAIAAGQPVAGGLWTVPAAGDVVYVAAEDSLPRLRQRIYAIAQALPWARSAIDRLHIIALRASSAGLILVEGSGEAARPTSDVDDLVAIARGTRAIFLDPLADLHTSPECDDVAARVLRDTKRDLSARTGAGVIGIAHQRKSSMLSGEAGGQTTRGSSVVPAGSRWTVTVQIPSPEDYRRRVLGIVGDEVDPERLRASERRRWTVIADERKVTDGDPVELRGGLYHFSAHTTEDGRTIPACPLYREFAAASAARKPQANGGFVLPAANRSRIGPYEYDLPPGWES